MQPERIVLLPPSHESLPSCHVQSYYQRFCITWRTRESKPLNRLSHKAPSDQKGSLRWRSMSEKAHLSKGCKKCLTNSSSATAFRNHLTKVDYEPIIDTLRARFFSASEIPSGRRRENLGDIAGSGPSGRSCAPGAPSSFPPPLSSAGSAPIDGRLVRSPCTLVKFPTDIRA
jgi:hypothetical protein